MIRLTAYISGRVQRVGYRAKVISLAKEMDLVGIVQNQPDGKVLVIAEGEKKENLEKFASAIRIENAFIHVDDLSAEYTQGTGQYSTFRKITGSNEVGERLDDGIEILKEMVVSLNNLTAITKDIAATTKDTAITVKDLTTLTKEGLAKQDRGLDKMDQMLYKQDETTEAIRDLKRNDERFVRMEKDIRMIKNRLGIR
ncbi:MAG: acylphosphatase, partial [Methanothrix sp.]|nr:acylphosphatase [Methanothrix sp.]